ncbi:MAG: hypothetical protein PVG79_10880, partial [Gemmatimonadales bacterium]
GASWLEWEHGLPTASMMALVVHPREHDLVIGTHGRSVYIIDDIRPLRELSAATLAEPIHLFEIPDAIQYMVKQTGASRFPGNGEFRGENRAYGALITFSLNVEGLPHPNEEIERERSEAERGAQAEEEEAEGRREREPQVTIEITDGDGELIRSFERPATLGVNRVVWRLDRDGFERPGAGEESAFFGGGGGPDVLPGSYGVTVKYGDREVSGSVTVLPDPRYDIRRSDRQAKFDLVMHVGALQETIAEAVERIGETRSEIDDALERAKDADAGEDEDEGAVADDDDDEGGTLEELAQAGEDLRKVLRELEHKLWTPPGTAKGIVYPTDVYSRLGYVRGSLSSSWDAPTPSQETYLAAVEAQLREIIADFNRAFAEDVAAFKRMVEEAELEFVGTDEPLEVPAR